MNSRFKEKSLHLNNQSFANAYNSNITRLQLLMPMECKELVFRFPPHKDTLSWLKWWGLVGTTLEMFQCWAPHWGFSCCPKSADANVSWLFPLSLMLQTKKTSSFGEPLHPRLMFTGKVELVTLPENTWLGWKISKRPNTLVYFYI